MQSDSIVKKIPENLRLNVLPHQCRPLHRVFRFLAAALFLNLRADLLEYTLLPVIHIENACAVPILTG